jgi:anaerobic magnesium-protoporphyrin IX monomethyl ester cyclase
MANGNVVLIAMYDIDSFAVRTLHAVLARQGFPVHSIFFKQLNENNTMDRETESEVQSLIGLLRRLNPILVGLSVRSTYFQLAACLSARIRHEIGCTVLWGGVHVTISPEECLDHADALCLGEGEETLVELAGRVSDNAAWVGIANLWFKRNGEVVRHALRPLIHDLDSLPFPDFLCADKYLIDKGQCRPLPDHAGRSFYWIMTSRGCPFSCTYCSNNALRRVYKDCGSYMRRRTVENVLEELALARKNFPNLSFVCFEDDVFTFDLSWIRRFQARYKEEIGLPFFCYCHPEMVTDEVIGLLRASGATSMTMGIQSGSERIRRDLFHRLGTNEEIVRAAHVLHRHGIACSYDIIMDNPLEDEQDRRQTLDLLLALPRPFELHTTTLTHFPQTDLTRLLLERGLIRRKDVEDMAQKSYERWSPSLDPRRDRENLFWDNLFYLASKHRVPERLIRSLSRSRCLRHHPAPLTAMLRLTSNYIQTAGYRSKFDLWRIRMVNKVLRKSHV